MELVFVFLLTVVWWKVIMKLKGLFLSTLCRGGGGGDKFHFLKLAIWHGNMWQSFFSLLIAASLIILKASTSTTLPFAVWSSHWEWSNWRSPPPPSHQSLYTSSHHMYVICDSPRNIKRKLNRVNLTVVGHHEFGHRLLVLCLYWYAWVVAKNDYSSLFRRFIIPKVHYSESSLFRGSWILRFVNPKIKKGS